MGTSLVRVTAALCLVPFFGEVLGDAFLQSITRAMFSTEHTSR